MSTKFIYVKENTEAKKVRDTNWIVVCPTCQFERTVTYSQLFNLKKEICSPECRDCGIKSGRIRLNLDGLRLGRKYHEKDTSKRDNTKNKKRLELVNMLNNVSKNSEVKEKMRNAKLGKIGPLANRWEGGRTSFRKAAMKRDDYKSLRKLVLKRDNYKCVLCSSNKKLEMDHIKEWCNYPELRYDPTNCRILCKECHVKTDNYGHNARKSNGL